MERCERFIREYLEFFCKKIPTRCVGTAGNRLATDFFARKLNEFGWTTEEETFDALDWKTEGATLVCDSQTTDPPSFAVCSSPYSLGCDVSAPLVEADSIERLESRELAGKIVLLHGELAKEPLMPKNFIFYNPDEHRRIVAALEKSGARAFVTATARHSGLAGGVYPFPLVEDGDFNVPSVFTTEEEGCRLAAFCGRTFRLQSQASRIPAFGRNVTGRKGSGKKRIVVTAHIDAKMGTPGAIDNATGVVVLLLLAESMKNDAFDDKTVELLALNGEDYYSVPGQLAFLRRNEGKFGDIALNINIDCAGYREGSTAVSLLDAPENVQKITRKLVDESPEFVEGAPWFQGDQSLFLQNGVASIVFASEWFLKNIETQTITHTPKDSPEIVRWQSVATIAETIRQLLRDIY